MKRIKKEDIIIQKKIKKLISNPPKQKFSDIKKGELFFRLHKNEEVPSIIGQLPNILATYNKFLDEHTKAIKALQKVIDDNPNSPDARVARRDLKRVLKKA